MTSRVDEIRAAQQTSWNKFAPGWRKWDGLMMEFMLPYADAMLEHLQPHGDQVVLDVAAGTGEPGLSIASRLSGGRVVMTDLAHNMLQVAIDKAAEASVANVEFRDADVSALPFPDAHFDAVSCRFGYMFFPDMQQATREMVRVLEPGGRIATAVWGAPEKNFWITCMAQNIARQIEVPPPEPGAPGMFRCAAPGTMRTLFEAAGLRDVAEREVTSTLGVSGPEQYWQMITDVAAPFVAALSKADRATVDKAKTDVIAAMNERYPNGAIAASGTVVVGIR